MEKQYITLWDNPNERGVWSFDGEYIYDPAGNKYDEAKIRATFWYQAYQKCQEGEAPYTILFMRERLENWIKLYEHPLEITIEQGGQILKKQNIELNPNLSGYARRNNS